MCLGVRDSTAALLRAVGEARSQPELFKKSFAQAILVKIIMWVACASLAESSTATLGARALCSMQYLGTKLLSLEIARGDDGRGLLGWRGSGLRLDDIVKSLAVTSGGGGGPPGFGRPFDNAVQV